jgi:hypothetical protein
MAEATGFKKPVHVPWDPVAQAPMEGRAPTAFYKLFSRGKSPFVEQTIFTGLDNKPIPWTMLQNVEMKFIPLLHFKRIYVGGGGKNISLQIEMLSAVVTYIKGRGTSSNQQATITRLQELRPDLGDQVSAQVAKLKMDRQELLLAEADKGVASTATEHGDAPPSFAGLVKTTNQLPAGGNLPNLNLPNMPALNIGQQSIGDFTGGAPQRFS